MKRIFREGTKLFGRTVMVLFISVFVCVSVSGLCTALSTEESGHGVYGTKENERNAVALYTHCNKDGTDISVGEKLLYKSRREQEK